MMSHPRSRFLAVTGLSIALLLSATACGDDEAAGDSPSTTAAPATTEAPAVPTEACDAYVELSGALAGDPSQAGSILQAFEETAPTDLADDAATVSAAYAALAQGDESALATDEFTEASGAVADAYFAGCETSAELDVEGVDYGFDGLPSEVPAGRVAIRFTNATEHDEPHEMVLFRRLPGTDEPVDELLALPEEEVGSKVEMSGVVFADRAGSESTSMLDLDAGEYVAVCFIPVGGGEDGPPHFTSGMVAEFSVA